MNLQAVLTLSRFVCYICVCLTSIDATETASVFPGQTLSKKLRDITYLVSPVECLRLCSNVWRCTECTYNTTYQACQIRSEAPVCGEAPDVPNAEKVTKGYSVGDVTIYTCNSAYAKCPKKVNKCVCQPTGQWGNVTGLCKRSRWLHPAVNKPFVIPCEPLRKFNILCQLRPTKKTRFFVTLLRGKYSILTLEFRLRFRNDGNVILLSSLMGGKWKRQVRFYHSMKVGKQMSVVIQLNHGYYKMTVDGDSKLYKSPNRRILPRLFGLGGDISVQLVEIKPGKRRQ